MIFFTLILIIYFIRNIFLNFLIFWFLKFENNEEIEIYIVNYDKYFLKYA